MRRSCALSLTAIGLLTAVTLLSAGAPPPLPVAAEGDDWIRVDTAHLTLFSDASEDGTVEIGRQMELFRAVLARLGPHLSADSPLPTFVFVFKNELSFTPYMLRQKGRHAGMPANIDGFFVPHRDGNYIGVNATPDNSPWPVIYHEYFHFFLHNNFDDIPLWFDEGMAECYSTFRREGGHVEIGGPIPAKLAWLSRHPLMPLSRLQATTFDSPGYNELEKQQTYYAQSWAMVHYLLWGPARQAEGGAGFLRDLKRGGSLKEVLALLTPAQDPALEQHVADFIKKNRFAYSEIALDSLQYDRSARVRRIGRDEVLYRLGDFLLHIDSDRVREAEDHLNEAIRLNPRLAAAHADLGQALSGRGRKQEAHAAFEKAMALDPANHSLALEYAYALIDEAMPDGFTEIDLDKVLPPEIARARALFQGAIGSASDVTEAWAGLGETYLYDDGDIAPGIAALERAHELMPTRTDIAHNLAELYARSGQRGRAQDLIDRVLERSEDPGTRAAGRTILFFADMADADALAAKGEIDAAAGRFRSLLSAAPDPKLKSVLEERLRTLDQFAGQNGAQAQMNAAVAKANAKQFDAAVEILERVQAAASAPEIAARAREVLAQVRDVQSIDQALALSRDGDYARATGMLNMVARDSKDPKIAQEARDQMAKVEASRGTDAYNQAIQKFNHHDYTGAVAILDRLIADTKDTALADKARELRGWAQQALAGKPAPSK
jgi:tetratricopeptide (TPR) repeat protein